MSEKLCVEEWTTLQNDLERARKVYLEAIENYQKQAGQMVREIGGVDEKLRAHQTLCSHKTRHGATTLSSKDGGFWCNVCRTESQQGSEVHGQESGEQGQMMNLGLGVMIRMLGGNKESVDAMTGAIGKKIAAVSLTDDALHFTFEDGTKIKLADEGQSCCENRYMRTDDDLSYFVGAELRGAEVNEAPSAECEYDSHDVEFLVVHTDKGDFTMSSHNEHNGYYGGFCVQASVVP
jgi:hypothetical protein